MYQFRFVIRMVWRGLYPVLIHFLGFEMVALLVYLLSPSALSHNLLLLNVMGTSFSIPFLLWFYVQDERKRLSSQRTLVSRLSLKDAVLVMIWGMALAQYGNILLSGLSRFSFFTEYTQSVEKITGNQSLLLVILWSAIAAPLSEELAFRWLFYKRLRDHLSVWPSILISSLVFGLYHGNPLQFLYAFLLGIALALVIEWTKSPLASLFFHIGANLWSTLISSFGAQILSSALLTNLLYFILFLFLVGIFLIPRHLKH